MSKTQPPGKVHFLVSEVKCNSLFMSVTVIFSGLVCKSSQSILRHWLGFPTPDMLLPQSTCSLGLVAFSHAWAIGSERGTFILLMYSFHTYVFGPSCVPSIISVIIWTKDSCMLVNSLSCPVEGGGQKSGGDEWRARQILGRRSALRYIKRGIWVKRRLWGEGF